MKSEDEDLGVPKMVGDDVSLRGILLGQRHVRELRQEPVPRELVEECIELSRYGATDRDLAFVLVEAQDKRRSIGELS